MKKLVFFFFSIVTDSFAACGNKTEQAAPVDADSIEEVVDSVVDSLATDSVVADSAAVAE